MADDIGADRVGIRFSPHSTFNDHEAYEDVAEQYGWLAQKVDALNLVYVHLVLGQEACLMKLSGDPGRLFGYTDGQLRVRQGWR